MATTASSAPAEAPHLANPDENPSFIKGLFLGELREDLVFPFPELSAEERRAVLAVRPTEPAIVTEIECSLSNDPQPARQVLTLPLAGTKIIT